MGEIPMFIPRKLEWWKPNLVQRLNCPLSHTYMHTQWTTKAEVVGFQERNPVPPNFFCPELMHHTRLCFSAQREKAGRVSSCFGEIKVSPLACPLVLILEMGRGILGSLGEPPYPNMKMIPCWKNLTINSSKESILRSHFDWIKTREKKKLLLPVLGISQAHH